MIPVTSINDLFFSMFSGLYPGDHNIIANQFADENSSDKKYFDKNNEDTTGHLKWWHNNEPIWATANKNHKNFSTFLWSRCDVAYHDRHTIGPSVSFYFDFIPILSRFYLDFILILSKGLFSKLSGIFVCWVKDFKLWLLAYSLISFNCAKFQQD